MSKLCEDCRVKDKKMRVMQADIDFQVKKMREDLAEEKVYLEQQLQKDYKKAIQKYNKERVEREEENQKWISKYDNMVCEFEEKIDQIEGSHQLASVKIKEELSKTYSYRQCSQNEQHEHEVSTIKKEHEHALNDLRQNQTKKFTMLQKHEEKAIVELQSEHQNKIGIVTCDYEGKVNQLKREITEVTTSRDSLQKEASLKQNSLYQQIFDRKQEITNLKYQMDCFESTIRSCEEQIRLKNLEIEVLKEKHDEDVSQMNKQYECSKEKVIQEFNHQIEGILVKKLEDCSQFQQNVKEIEQKRENQFKIYKSCLKEVKERVEVQNSREKDYEQINILKDMLNQKERDHEQALDEVKSYKLELDYKEETINRIFPGGSSQIPLNIEKILNMKRQKSSKGSTILMREPAKYNTVKTIHNFQDTKKDKDRYIQSKTLKLLI